MTISLDSMRQQIRDRAAAAVDLAGQQIVGDLYDAAGPGLPDGAVQSTITPLPAEVVLRLRVDTDSPDSVTVWEWVVGEPSHPFHPHQRLAGVTFDETNWRDVLASDGGYPGGPYYTPGDHDGCQCTVDIVIGDLVFDAAALDARPIVVRAFGVDVAVNPAAPQRIDVIPAWWSQTLTAERWRSALRTALDTLA